MEQKTKADQLLIRFVSLLTEKLVSTFLRDQQVICTMACVIPLFPVAPGASTQLFLPPDFTNQSAVSYVNNTSATLLPGQKVYLLYKFGDISQGWIAHK
jgi:hypothetical protein